MLMPGTGQIHASDEKVDERITMNGHGEVSLHYSEPTYLPTAFIRPRG